MPRLPDQPVPEADNAHDLMPAWLASHIPPLYATENQSDPTVWTKFFTPDSGWSWYVCEFDGVDLCFGFVDGLYPELGYFTLSELAAARGPMGLAIERDLWFEPKALSAVEEDVAVRHAPDI